MNSKKLRQKYIQFFEKKGHKQIPQASLVPENDPTVLFTTAGMHPLIPYILGEKHPEGTKLVNIQRCIRTEDIEEVGDDVHNTFFEMLGNWSFGDYWKKEAIEWSFEFLTKELEISKDKIGVTCFEGNADVSRDEESIKIWKDLGIDERKIVLLGKKDNFWGPAGATGPCGPDTEMFIWTGKEKVPKDFNPNDPKWVEIWNNVFMGYAKISDGKYEPMDQKNVDTGMGLERTAMVLQGVDNVYETDLFKPILDEIKKFGDVKTKDLRILADHLKACVFLIMDGVEPSNTDQGYILRRLIRKMALIEYKNKLKKEWLENTLWKTIKIYEDYYSRLNQKLVVQIIQKESDKFKETISKGLVKFQEAAGIGKFRIGVSKIGKKLSGKDLFDLYQTHGFPLELSLDIAEEEGAVLEENAKKEFKDEFQKHQKSSRAGAEKKFKGGLADHSEIAKKYHTTTHILHQVLRDVLGDKVLQKGSNITSERLRFDFAYPEKLTPMQIVEVEKQVNKIIQADMPIECKEMLKEDAKKFGALGIFEEKYGDRVKVYFIGDPSAGSGQVYSKEICGGPHINHTGELGKFKITNEKSSSAGIRRIKAILQ
ncbi:MAG: alanine--tRNA ligase [bacterium]